MPFDDGMPHKRFAADFIHHPWYADADDNIVWKEPELLTLPLVRRYECSNAHPQILVGLRSGVGTFVLDRSASGTRAFLGSMSSVIRG